jgi:hypothetical protein
MGSLAAISLQKHRDSFYDKVPQLKFSSQTVRKNFCEFYLAVSKLFSIQIKKSKIQSSICRVHLHVRFLMSDF